MKATEQCFSVVLFFVLFKVVLTFETVGKILHCDKWKLLSSTSYGLFVMLFKVVPTF